LLSLPVIRNYYAEITHDDRDRLAEIDN